MLDTIKLRYHGILDFKNDALSLVQKQEQGLDNACVPAHHQLYKAILKSQKKNLAFQKIYKRRIDTHETIDESEFLERENSQKINHFQQVRTMMQIKDAKGVKDMNLRINGTYRVPSSENSVTFTINENAGYIDFEFSIPKYLYGHSLAEFVPQGGSKLANNNYFDRQKMSFQKKHLFKRLVRLIDRFNTDLCQFFELEEIPEMKYIEVRRIDLCYNQRFKTKSDALQYLENQKKLKTVQNRKNAEVSQDYNTSFSYLKRSGAYSKVYHKGSEYSQTKGDLKKHLDLNKIFIEENLHTFSKQFQDGFRQYRNEIYMYYTNKGKGIKTQFALEHKEEIQALIKYINWHLPYDIPFLKKEMDKILRYEISMSSKSLSYLYKNRVFRRQCKFHLDAKEVYKAVKSNYEKALDHQKKVSKREVRIYRDFHKWSNRTISLMLDVDPFHAHLLRSGKEDFNPNTGEYKIQSYSYKYTILSNRETGQFNYKMLSVLFAEFISFFEHFQIEKIDTYETFRAKVYDYNEKAKENLKAYNENNVFKVIDHLTGERKRNSRGKLLKPSDLLKQTEKRKLKLKGVNTNLVLMIYRELTRDEEINGEIVKKGKSLNDLKKEMDVPYSTFNRWLKELELLDIHVNSLKLEKEIECTNDFKEYYYTTAGMNYKKGFYTLPVHYKSF